LENEMQVNSAGNQCGYGWSVANNPWSSFTTALSSNEVDIAAPANSTTAQTANSAGSVQLATQTIVALLNAQENLYGADQAPSDPTSPSQTPPAAFINPATTPDDGFAIANSDGTLTASDVQGQSAASLTANLISAFGSNGTLSLNDVDNALGLNDSTVSPTIIQHLKSEIATAWNSLSGGSSELSSGKLESAIGSYLSAIS
jgi:hypothetical protein